MNHPELPFRDTSFTKNGLPNLSRIINYNEYDIEVSTMMDKVHTVSSLIWLMFMVSTVCVPLTTLASLFVPQYRIFYYWLAGIDGLCVLSLVYIRLTDNYIVFEIHIEQLPVLLFLFGVMVKCFGWYTIFKLLYQIHDFDGHATLVFWSVFFLLPGTIPNMLIYTLVVGFNKNATNTNYV